MSSFYDSVRDTQLAGAGCHNNTIALYTLPPILCVVQITWSFPWIYAIPIIYVVMGKNCTPVLLPPPCAAYRHNSYTQSQTIFQ